MKKIILAVTAICMLAMISCNPQDRKDDPQPDPILLNQYDSAEVYRLDQNGDYVKEYTCYYRYDEAGNQVEALEDTWKNVRVFDAHHNKIEDAEYMRKPENMSSTYEGEWIPFRKEVCRYNDKNQVEHRDTYRSGYPEWKLEMFEDFVYSEDGRKANDTRGILYYIDTSVADTAVSYVEMTIDEHGNMLSFYVYRYSGQDKVEMESGRREYTYDQHGNVSTEHEVILYGGKTTTDHLFEYTYTYDHAGNMLEKILKYHEISGSSERQTTYKYVYFY